MKIINKKIDREIITNLFFSILIVLVILFSSYVNATDAPYLEISHIANCSSGSTISFNVYIKGKNITNINLTKDSIQLIDFKADISIKPTGSKSYQVVLANVSGGQSGNRVVIAGNVATANDNKTGNAYSSAVTSNTFDIIGTDSVSPILSIIGPSSTTVKNGDTITFVARYTDNVKIKDVILYKNSIKLNGFTANISISGSGANSKVVERTITLSNIQGSNGNKSITICGATASDESLNRANGATSKVFTINNNTGIENTQDNNDSSTNENDENNPSTQINNEENTVRPSDWIENPKTGIY